jgi:hypothetical protein
MDASLAYCTTCRRHHYFGFDEIGCPVEMLACRRGPEPPRRDMAASKSTAVSLSPDPTSDLPSDPSSLARDITAGLDTFIADIRAGVPVECWEVDRVTGERRRGGAGSREANRAGPIAEDRPVSNVATRIRTWTR